MFGTGIVSVMGITTTQVRFCASFDSPAWVLAVKLPGAACTLLCSMQWSHVWSEHLSMPAACTCQTFPDSRCMQAVVGLQVIQNDVVSAHAHCPMLNITCIVSSHWTLSRFSRNCSPFIAVGLCQAARSACLCRAPPLRSHD